MARFFFFYLFLEGNGIPYPQEPNRCKRHLLSTTKSGLELASVDDDATEPVIVFGSEVYRKLPTKEEATTEQLVGILLEASNVKVLRKESLTNRMVKQLSLLT